MRLPDFLKKLSPVGETLAAVEAGEALLSAAAAEKNAQFSVRTATEALSLWEADYGLQDRSGGNMEQRRLDIRIAMAEGRTLTRTYLKELAVTLCDADTAEVAESFPDGKVTLYAIAATQPPADSASLERAIGRLKPAHLLVEIVPVGAMTGTQARVSALHGGTLTEIWA